MNRPRTILPIFLLMVLATVGLAAFARADEAIRPDAGKAAPATVGAVSSVESVQACIDKSRKSDWEYRKGLEKAVAPTKKALFTFSPADPSKMPADCPEGDLPAYRKALRQQLAACGKASARKTGAEIRKICDAPSPPEWCARPDSRHRHFDRMRRVLSKTYNDEAKMQFGCRSYTRREWCVDSSRQLLKLASQAKDFSSFMAAAKQEFDWYQSDGKIEDDKSGHFKKGDVQFTSYYAPPALEASAQPTEQFKYPIYRRPENLVQLNDDDPKSCGYDAVTGVKRRWCLRDGSGSYTPAPTRKEIDLDHALKDPKLPIAYVKDPLEVAFLMVQGSGSIRLTTPEGKKIIHINYDGENGRTRVMLARVIKCDGGKKEDYESLDGIRNYIKTHNDRFADLMNFDQSYIFYKAENDDPKGAGEVFITGRHSLAVDPSVIPLGAATLFRTKRLGGPTDACHEITTMAMAQDTGGAIRGAHVDWYAGEGAEAEKAASSVNQAGALYVGLPKGSGQPVEGCDSPKLAP